MNLAKSLEFFNPSEFEDSIHIIGCGAIGSTLIENLTRMGIQELDIYDFDDVTAHNIANQMFAEMDINRPKEDCVEEIAKSINHDIKINKHGKYENQTLTGYVFLCVDSIDLRRKIVEANKDNKFIKAMFDFRMRLTDAQHYAANWRDEKQKETLLKTMQFSHEEAAESTPVSACGTTLNVVYCPRTIVALGVSNFINFVKSDSLKTMMLLDTKSFTLDVFPIN